MLHKALYILTALCALGCTACGLRETQPQPAAPLPTAQIALAAQTPPLSGRVLPLRTASPRAATPTPPDDAAASPAPTAYAPIAAPAGSSAPPDDAAAREALLVAEINRTRAANSLPPYQSSPELAEAARAHSCDLAAHQLISHASSDGRTLAQRLAGSVPAWEWPSENIAAGYDDPLQVVALWMDEPPDGWHRRNILDTQQQAVGAGFCYSAEDPSGNHFYWTADFARRAAQ